MSTASQIFALDGARCAGCVLKIERNLQSLPGVELARGNATQKRMRLIWDETKQSSETLIHAIHDLGYGATAIDTDTSIPAEPSLLPRLAAAAIGTMNIMAFSISVWSGLVTDMSQGTIQTMHWLSAAVALPVVLYSGSVFHGPALKALRSGRMTMDTPISLAIWVTYLASLYGTVQGSHAVYFDAVVSLIFFLLIGRVLEQSLRRRSGDAAGNLRTLMQVTAHRLAPDGSIADLPAQELSTGDRIIVYTAERIPADAILQSENAELDESVLTGETLPRRASCGSDVAAGAVLIAGPAELLVTHVGEDAQLGRVAQLVEDVAAHKGRMQQMSDHFAQSYIPLVLGGGALGFGWWYFALGAEFSEALMIAVAVLVVTCPCAAGLATPAVTSRAVNLLMKAGVVVKSGEALEALGDVDMIYIDKTGTAAQPHLVLSGDISAEVLGAARALAVASRHPLAVALVAGHKVKPATGAVEHIGQGIVAKDGARLGSARFVGAADMVQGTPTLWFREASGELHRLLFQEVARDDLSSFLKDTKALDVPVTLISGDAASAVRRFAETSLIKAWIAEQDPEDKLAKIQRAQKDGNSILMVGDGVNDSAALSAASVSASFAGATQIAQMAADIVLTQPRLSRLPDAILLSRQARRLILQNLSFATIYNFVTVPLALAGMLTPLIAALLMSSSSVIVLANGLRLKGIK